MNNRLKQDLPTTCRIQIQGHLGQSWSDYLGGLTISVRGEPEQAVTTLSGQVIDQAALMGVINNLYNLGYPLLFVECSY
jgi:hypothetical protein